MKQFLINYGLLLLKGALLIPVFFLARLCRDVFATYALVAAAILNNREAFDRNMDILTLEL